MVIKCDNCKKEFNCPPSNLTRYGKHYCSIMCKHEAEQMFAPNILEFQQELWEKPITELAKEHNISVKTIHKFCKKHELLKPGRGYWQKKNAGLI